MNKVDDAIAAIGFWLSHDFDHEDHKEYDEAVIYIKKLFAENVILLECLSEILDNYPEYSHVIVNNALDKIHHLTV